jgi:hypothetical protein
MLNYPGVFSGLNLFAALGKKPHVEPRGHEVEPLGVPAAVFVRYIDGVTVIGIRVMEPFVAVAEIVFSKVVGGIDIDHVDLAAVAGLERRHALEIVAFDEHVRAVVAMGIFLNRLKEPRRRNLLAVKALALPLEIQAFGGAIGIRHDVEKLALLFGE